MAKKKSSSKAKKSSKGDPIDQAELTTVNFRLQAKMEELERATNDLNSLLSSTDLAVLFLDTQFCIRLFTPALKDLFDVIPSDLGRPLTDLARKFNDNELLADAQVVLEKATRLEKEIVSKSGRIYVRRILPYRAADSSIKGVVVTFIDIDERKHAETALWESEEQYRLIFASLRDYAIFMLDREGRIASWNSGAERVLKFTRNEAVGQPLSLIFGSEDRKAGMPARELQQAQKLKSITQEGWRMRKDGIRFWGVGTLTALVDASGKFCGYVKILRDYTDHKLSEEALKQASRIAEEANKAKDNFLANVSHELRTPLGAIVLWINLLEEEGAPVSRRVRETLDAIKKCADEQGKLIEDLVDTSRIVAGNFRLDFKEIQLGSVVQAAIESIRPYAIEKGLKIEGTLDSRIGIVNADPSRIQQVIWNLLNNAIKFTPTGGSVKVEVSRYDKNVEIRVTDTGQGISKEFLPYVFERFGQADQFAGGNLNKGLGLGLSIAKQIVEMHGGTISAESDGPQKGAGFIVWLPLPDVAVSGAVAVEKPPRQKLSKALAGRHVLLIEDTKQTREALTAVLQRANAEVTVAGSAKAALESFGQRRPDLIVSDIGLPDIDGYKLITQIRTIEKASNIPSVPALALTAFAGKNVRSKALKSGFQLCLTKPIEARELISTLILLQEPV
jgi:two-component system, chemotaxis family, CheB/CheR fusion protein